MKNGKGVQDVAAHVFEFFEIKVFLHVSRRMSVSKYIKAIVVGVEGSSISSISGLRKGVRCCSRSRTSRSFSTLGCLRHS